MTSWSMPLPRWLAAQPDSLAAQDLRIGRSPWVHMVHLVWSVWVFMTPLFSDGGFGFTQRWVWLTLLSYPLFLWLYVTTVFASPRRAYVCALAMVVMCFALLPWYPSGLSYFVFGCVMLQPRKGRRVLGYVAVLAVLNAALIAYALSMGYPWQALVWLPTVTAIIGVLVMVERINHEREAALKLSHEEVRRLAALAERERIGRDLHDLLGHTLSMVALKSDLAGRLLARVVGTAAARAGDGDVEAARREIADVAATAREALAQVRGAVSGIRAAGIAAELASARLLLELDGVSFDYGFDAEMARASLPPAIETALAMTVREAVTNIQRHAGATRATVAFAVERGHAVLRISDDGRGGAIQPGNGLAGMRERLESVRGSLRIDAVKGRGTHLEARLPLASSDAAAV